MYNIIHSCTINNKHPIYEHPGVRYHTTYIRVKLRIVHIIVIVTICKNGMTQSSSRSNQSLPIDNQ